MAGFATNLRHSLPRWPHLFIDEHLDSASSLRCIGSNAATLLFEDFSSRGPDSFRHPMPQPAGKCELEPEPSFPALRNRESTLVTVLFR